MRIRKKNETLKKRFDRFTEQQGEHLIWIGAKRGSSYGVLRIKDKLITATRVAWFLHTGQWPSKWILHKNNCNNKSCVNINHLYEGTGSDNTYDQHELRKLKKHYETYMD